jgi:hypothetical protein
MMKNWGVEDAFRSCNFGTAPNREGWQALYARALSIHRVQADTGSRNYIATRRRRLACVMIAGQKGSALSPESSQKKRGMLNHHRVVVFSFWTTALCILVAVVASILAIWEFTGTDALWRTVATCMVIGVGTLAFSWVNSLFGLTDD